MSNKNCNLGSPNEILDIYGMPVFNDFDRKKYYTLNKETTRFGSYTNINDVIYFLVFLVFHIPLRIVCKLCSRREGGDGEFHPITSLKILNNDEDITKAQKQSRLLQESLKKN